MNRQDRNRGYSAAFLLCLIAATACPRAVQGAQESPAESVRIALVAPISGPSSSLGNEMHEAATKAIEWVNERGGLLGARVALEIRDDGCDPSRGAQVALELIRDFRPHAVLGYCVDPDGSITSIYDSNRTIFFAPPSHDHVVPERRYPRYAFHLGVRGDRSGEAAAAAILESWEGVDRIVVGIVRDPTPLSTSIASGFERELAKRGVKLAFDVKIRSPGEFAKLVEADKPDVVFCAARDPGLVRKWVADVPTSADLVVLGLPSTADGAWDEFWKWEETLDRPGRVEVFAPASLGGEYLLPKTPFLEVCRQLRDGRPSLAQIYVLSAIDLLVQVIEETGTADPDAIQTALRGKPRPTLLGEIRSGETGEVKPIPYELYHSGERWTPSRAFWIDAERREPKSAGLQPTQYNVTVEPNESRDPLVLIPGRPTEITFWIGEPVEESVAGGLEPGPMLEAIAAGEPVGLTVTLYSHISDEATYQQREIVFDPAMEGSTRARFEIVPSAKAVSDSAGIGEFVFVVDARGMEIDVLRFSAIVGEPTEEAKAAYVQPGKVEMEALVSDEISCPDLVLSITPQDGSSRIAIVIRPILRELKDRIQKDLGDASADFWVLASGLTRPSLEGLIRDAYTEMRGIVEQNNSELQRVYKSIGVDTAIGAATTLLQFSSEDRTRILKRIQAKGSALYWRLFQGDPRLATVMRSIDSFVFERPLRVRILAAEVYAPWQILYPDNAIPVDPARFWGFRYEMGTLQLVDAAPGRPRTVMQRPSPGDVVFARWRASGPKDSVAERATLLAEHLQKKVGGGIQVKDSRDTLKTALTNGAASLKLLFAYGHGSSGTKLVVYDEAPPIVVVVQDVAGQCFLFSKEELLTPSALDEWNPRTVPRHLASQPIVILNACETGTSGTQPQNDNGFIGAFSRSGARDLRDRGAGVGQLRVPLRSRPDRPAIRREAGSDRATRGPAQTPPEGEQSARAALHPLRQSRRAHPDVTPAAARRGRATRASRRWRTGTRARFRSMTSVPREAASVPPRGWPPRAGRRA